MTRVSFICTANRARSPFAAVLLGAMLREQPVTIESFGVQEQRGAPALSGAIRAASTFGVDLNEHRAQPLRAASLTTASLVVGFEPIHIEAAVAFGGAALRRSFLLVELSDVLEIDVHPWPVGALDLDARISHADSRRYARGRLPRSIEDPAGGSDSRFHEVYEQIERRVEIIATELFGVGSVSTR